MKFQRGFTITELIMAMGLAVIIVSSATALVYGFLQQNANFQEWSDTVAESQMLKEDLNRIIRNTARLDPVEDLVMTGDALFYGITDVPAVHAPTECNFDQSILRFVSYDHTKPSARILRPWNEILHVGETNLGSELRVTSDDDDALFNKDNGPSEIVIADAEIANVRRYKIKKYTLYKNHPKDPYDDQPKKDIDGSVKRFNFAAIQLEMPEMIKGGTSQKKAVGFITGSEVFATSTSIICQAKADGSLIQIDQSNNKTEVLLQNPVGKYLISNFKVEYAAPKAKTEVNEFLSSIVTTDLISCVNAIRLEIELSLKDAQNKKAGLFVSSETNSIKSSRLLFLYNYQAKRPAFCF